MSLIVIAKIGADYAQEIGFIPTVQLEELDLPRTTDIPFNFDRKSAKGTYEEAVAVAEREAIRIINQRYPEGTKYLIEKDSKINHED